MTLRFFTLLLALMAGCATGPRKNALQRFSFETPQMGVPFKIVLYAASEAEAEAAAKAAFDRVSYLNSLMSDYEYDSELSKLGRTFGERVKVSPELWTVLKSADEMSRASRGAFDVTVGPYIQLWRKARREKKMPPRDLLDRAHARVGYTNMVFRRGTVEMRTRDMRLDLGAIAKGYAADEALRILRERGITRAFAAASGDMVLGDAPPGEKGWKVQLLAPETRAQSSSNAFLVLRNCGVATSGDLFQFVEIDGKRYSHIVDPRTGIGLTDRSLVTIIARNGMDADRLSTAVSVMGPTDGIRLARRFGAEGRATRQMEEGARVEWSTPGFWKNALWLK